MATIYVPDNYPSIQQAINASSAGDTIMVRPGTYTEPTTTTPMITINKSLTIQSTDGPTATILDGNSATDRYYMVSIEANDVVFNGFTVTNPLYTGAADASGILTSLSGRPTNVKILNNIVHDIGSLTRPVASFGTFGLNVGPVDGLEIGNNVIYNIGNNDSSDPNNNGWAIGIFVYGNDSQTTANNVNIHDNTIYNIVSPVNVNDGVNCGENSENITVANNNIHASGLKRGIVTNPGMLGPVTITGNRITGAALYGILLRSPFAQVVTYNTITQCGIGIQINNTVTTTPEIHYNNIYNNVNYGLVNQSSVTVDAQNNWWGSAEGPNTPGADKVSGLTPSEYTPFLQAPVGATVSPLVRILSSGGPSGLTYVSAVSRDDAIAGAIGNTSTAVKATVITNPFPFWPRIAPYTNSDVFDNITLPGGQTVPQFVWDSTTSDGETRFFAMAAPFTPTNSLSGLLISVANFADNAHNYQASIYDATTKLLVAQTPVRFDGDTTTPAIGLTETMPPYNWQIIRSDSQLLSTPLAAGTSYYVVVSYDVLNYLNPPGDPNPAGLSFMVDVWNVM